MKTFEVPRNRILVLPKSLFKPADKVVVFVEGNTLIVKKLESPRLSSFAPRVKERPFPMSSVMREVQAYRKAKRLR